MSFIKNKFSLTLNKKMSLETIVRFYKDRDLDGDEIYRLIGKLPVLYSDLKNYKTLKQLLGKEGYAVVLYQTSSKTNGHFVSISESDSLGTIRFCDSYGTTVGGLPDSEIQYSPYDKALPKYLSNLIYSDGRPLEYNKVDYQSLHKGVSVCGRYASLFCLWKELSLSEINELFNTNKTPYLTPDNIVVMLTLVGLKDIRKLFS